MIMLKICPCGKTPDVLSITDANQGGKWACVSCDKCGEWTIEFRTQYCIGEELVRLATEAWNEAPRHENLAVLIATDT